MQSKQHVLLSACGFGLTSNCIYMCFRQNIQDIVSGKSPAAIVGTIIGVVFIVVLIVALRYYYIKMETEMNEQAEVRAHVQLY
jgi:hypothetical protein